LPLFQPLTAAFYPVSVLPEPLRTIAYFLSPTYVFEAARFTLANHSIEWNFIGLAFVENIIYCIIAIWFFRRMFNASKDTGQFARNES
jgi:ABC-2 type transport system permease protein